MSTPRGMLRGIFRPVVLRTLVFRFLTGVGVGVGVGGAYLPTLTTDFYYCKSGRRTT